MTKETAEKVARHNSIDEIQKWSSRVAGFVISAHSSLMMAERGVCKVCPFRNKTAMGGCIGEECPINAVHRALALATKRAAAGAKEIYKAKYAMRVSA